MSQFIARIRSGPFGYALAASLVVATVAATIFLVLSGLQSRPVALVPAELWVVNILNMTLISLLIFTCFALIRSEKLLSGWTWALTAYGLIFAARAAFSAPQSGWTLNDLMWVLGCLLIIVVSWVSRLSINAHDRAPDHEIAPEGESPRL
jgi:hypothetical protein